MCVTMNISMWFHCYIFFFKQKTAYEMRISDLSSDVCSSDLPFAWRSEYIFLVLRPTRPIRAKDRIASLRHRIQSAQAAFRDPPSQIRQSNLQTAGAIGTRPELSTSGQPERFSRSADPDPSRQRRIQCLASVRSDEHTSELQSLMRISYAVFC